MQTLRRLLPVFVLVISAVTVFNQRASAVVSTTQSTTTTADETSKYLRFVPDKFGGGTLQASVVRFENKDGVTVDLVAAVHIAEREFYAALDQSFADYDAVLYELVAPKDMLSPTTQGSHTRKLGSTTRPATRKSGASLAWISSLQQSMKNTLKLSFQLEQIDYRRPNFVHADLDAETFADLQSAHGESMFSLMLNSMMHEMANPQVAAAEQPGIFDLLAALQSPDKAKKLKMMLGRQFGAIDEQFDSDSVIVGERNKAALNVLRDQLANETGKHFAIFYGAAHLKLMEATLETEMGFHQVGPPFWRVAWDMSETKPPTTRPTTRFAQ